MEYKVQPVKNEDGSEAKITGDSIIEKRGHVITFSMQQILDNDKLMERNLKELEAKRAYEAAKMTNIEVNHPFVLKFTVQELFTAHMYQEARTMVGMCDVKIKEIKDQLESDKQEMEDIKAQIPELATVEATEQKPVISPFQGDNNGEIKETGTTDLV